MNMQVGFLTDSAYNSFVYTVLLYLNLIFYFNTIIHEIYRFLHSIWVYRLTAPSMKLYVICAEYEFICILEPSQESWFKFPVQEMSQVSAK